MSEKENQALSTITPKLPIKIGIAGENYNDGMGDLSHILNVAQALSREGVTEVTYHIKWSLVESKEDQEISPNNIDIIRLNQLVNKLKYVHIIPENQKVTGTTINEFMDNIKKVSNGKFEIIGRDQDQESSSESQDLWVSVSIGAFEKQEMEENLDYVKFITINEHNVDCFLSCGDILYKMGITLGPENSRVGIMLNDHIDRTIKDRVKALQQIHHPQFQQLLKQGTTDINNLENIIKITEFIPAYPQHMDEIYANKLIIECLTKVDKEKQVFMKLGGTYNVDSLISDKTNLEKLKNSGFTNIQYFKDGQIENIEIPQASNTPKRNLKLLTKYYLNEEENAEFAKLTGSFSICSGDNTLQDAISYGAIPIFIPHMKGKEDVLSNLEDFLDKQNFPNSAKYVHTYKNKELFWGSKPESESESEFGNSKGIIELFKEFLWGSEPEPEPEFNNNSLIHNYKVIEVLKEVTPELLEEWPKACKEIVANFNLNNIFSLYLDRLESGSEFRTAGDLLAKYLDHASNGTTLNIHHPELTENDLRPIKQPQIVNETEILKAIIYHHKINGNKDPIEYAEYYNIKLKGKSAIHYAMERNIKIINQNPIVYSQNALEDTEDHKFYIKDPKDDIEKSPIQYAIDNNIKLNNQDPAIYAIKNQHFFNNNGIEINGRSAIAEYALQARKTEDNMELIKYVIDKAIKIQNQDPIVYFQEKGEEFYIEEGGNLISPIKYAIVNDIKINKKYESQIKKDIIQEIETIFEENGKALSEQEKIEIVGSIFESHEDL